MASPKGHKPYPGCEKGGKFGYLGCPDNYFTDEELETLGKGVVEWIKQDNHIWMKRYFLDQWITWNTVEKLRARSPMFAAYLEMAKSIQESKLLSEPYYKDADGNHARFILARHHKGEWEEKVETATTDQTQDLQKALDLIKYLQDSAKAQPAKESTNNDQHA